VAGLAGLLRREGRASKSAELLGLVDAHPATEADVKQNTLEPLRAALAEDLPAAELQSAIERGRSMDLAATVAGFLAGVGKAGGE